MKSARDLLARLLNQRVDSLRFLEEKFLNKDIRQRAQRIDRSRGHERTEKYVDEKKRKSGSYPGGDQHDHQKDRERTHEIHQETPQDSARAHQPLLKNGVFDGIKIQRQQ